MFPPHTGSISCRSYCRMERSFCLRFALQPAQLDLRLGPLLAAFLLDPHDLVQRRDEVFVGGAEGLDVDDARSDSLAVSMVAILRVSAFFLSIWLVSSVTPRWAAAACWEWVTPRARTIWDFHSGMVLTRVDWILSTIRVSLFWISRIWGPIWIEIIRVRVEVVELFLKPVAEV